MIGEPEIGRRRADIFGGNPVDLFRSLCLVRLEDILHIGGAHETAHFGRDRNLVPEAGQCPDDKPRHQPVSGRNGMIG
ncbi:hypothetical protein D3C71_1889810 [compost metagenome]